MSLPYRLGSSSIFIRPRQESIEPKRVVFLSVEGTKTETSYFKLVESHKNELGIQSIVHVEVLRRNDTYSDPENVLDLLEEYIQFREHTRFEQELSSLNLKNYDINFIRNYIENPSNIPPKQRHKFEAVLKEEQLDLVYLDFLSKYHGESDSFGVVIDRDFKSHSSEQMNRVISQCRRKNYLCFISNPCIEFWQLLHVSDVSVEFADQLSEILKNELDEHGNTFVSNLLFAKTGQRKAIPAKTFEKYYMPNIDLAIERSHDFASSGELLEKIGSNLGELFMLLREN